MVEMDTEWMNSCNKKQILRILNIFMIPFLLKVYTYFNRDLCMHVLVIYQYQITSQRNNPTLI